MHATPIDVRTEQVNNGIRNLRNLIEEAQGQLRRVQDGIIANHRAGTPRESIDLIREKTKLNRRIDAMRSQSNLLHLEQGRLSRQLMEATRAAS